MIAILFISCGNERANSPDNVLSIDYRLNSRIRLSEFVNEMTIVPLETSDSCLIGEITKIRLFDNKVYLLDMLSNSVFVYDISGKFVNGLNEAGQGPGEYIRITDLAVNEKGIYVLDISSHKINHYGFDFNFIDEIKIQTVGSSFMMNHTDFWIYNEPTLQANDYQLTQINEKGIAVAGFFPRKTIPARSYYSASSNVFQKNGGTLYFSPRYANEIYEMTNDNTWMPCFQLSFKDKTCSSELNISDEDIEGNEYIFRRNFYLLDRFLAVDYMRNNRRYFSFYDRKTRQIISGKVENDLIPDYDRFFPRWSDNNCLIESVEAEYVQEDFTGLIKAASLSELHPDDNPVLVIYTFKNQE
jgi:hypothetical protein